MNTFKRNCPCGSGLSYPKCCGAYISHQQRPSTPEALMRSRYTAYTQVNLEYIAATMKSPAADHFDIEAAQAWASSVKWLGLEVIKTQHRANQGMVEFRAHYSIDGKKNILAEISQFHLEHGKWYYIDGRPPNQIKIKPNQLCPCGSNIKYKKCCKSG